MNGEELRELIKVIIDFIPYIYPGIISISFYNFLSAVSVKENKLFLIKAVSVGYIYNMILGKISVLNRELQYNIMLIIMSVVIPYVLYKLIHSRVSKSFFEKLGSYTDLIDNDLELMCTGQEYNCVRLYVKNKQIIYEGYVRTYEKEHDRKRYIILTDYKLVSVDKKFKEKTIIERKGDVNDSILIYLDDIDKIEKCSYKRISQPDINKKSESQ